MRVNFFQALGLAVFLASSVLVQAADNTSMVLTYSAGKHQLGIKESREISDGGKIGKWSYDLTSTGIGTPEKLQSKGKITLNNNVKTLAMDENGVTSKGVKVENKVVLTRGVVNGMLTEVLKRDSKKSSDVAALGGLPSLVKVTYEADGNRHSRIWFDPKANPEQDVPDKEYVTERGKTPLNPTVSSTPVREGTDAGMTPIFSLTTGIAFNLLEAGGEAKSADAPKTAAKPAKEEKEKK